MGLEAENLFGIVSPHAVLGGLHPRPSGGGVSGEQALGFHVCAILVYGFGPLSQSKNRQLFTELE